MTETYRIEAIALHEVGSADCFAGAGCGKGGDSCVYRAEWMWGKYFGLCWTTSTTGFFWSHRVY
jgi:hypothetical protein